MMVPPVVVLHLADFHFGAEAPESDTARERQAVLDGLLRFLETLEERWRPALVAVTGDIAHAGKRSDYVAAVPWFRSLLRTLELEPEGLIVAAGNHDLDRSQAVGMGYPTGGQEADAWLSLPFHRNLTRLFGAFSRFAQDMGVPPLRLAGRPERLAGVVDRPGIRVAVLNTAWYCRGRSDCGQLWVGNPPVSAVESELAPARGNRLCLGLLHHPPAWLHLDEAFPRNGRPGPLARFGAACDLVLTGHSEDSGNSQPFPGGALWLTTGPVFEGPGRLGVVQLVQVDGDRVTVLRAKWIPGLGHWSAEPPVEHVRASRRVEERQDTDLNESERTRDERRADAAELHAQIRRLKEGEPAGPESLLLVPAAFWHLTRHAGMSSIELFWEGLRLVLAGSPRSVAETLALVEPTLAAVDPAILRRVLQAGAHSKSAEIRALARLLESLARGA